MIDFNNSPVPMTTNSDCINFSDQKIAVNDNKFYNYDMNHSCDQKDLMKKKNKTQQSSEEIGINLVTTSNA
jgi:hypothetical protein